MLVVAKLYRTASPLTSTMKRFPIHGKPWLHMICLIHVCLTTRKQRNDGYSAFRIVTHAHCIAVKQAVNAHAAGGWPETGMAYPEK